MIEFDEIRNLHIEPSTVCNAACPGCPRNFSGGKTKDELELGTMSFSDFKKINQDSLFSNLEIIVFCGNYGDPIACRDLPEMVEYVHQCNPHCTVRINTNGGIRSSDWWKRLAENSNNEKLVVIFSIDGLNDTNHIYRRNVNYNRVIENAQSYIYAGGVADWEYLIFYHNEHQVDIAREISKKLGFRNFIEKKPFGFEGSTLHSSTIPVYKSDQTFDYFIHESTRFTNDIDTPKIPDPLKIHYKTQEILPESVNNTFSKFDDRVVHCRTKKHKEIFIGHDGSMHPCCWLSPVTQTNNMSYALSPEDEMFNDWFNKNVDYNSINVFQRSIKDILESYYFTETENSWSKTHLEGRNPKCALFCGVKPTEDRSKVENVIIKVT